jgi:hypothetical protein
MLGYLPISVTRIKRFYKTHIPPMSLRRVIETLMPILLNQFKLSLFSNKISMQNKSAGACYYSAPGVRPDKPPSSKSPSFAGIQVNQFTFAAKKALNPKGHR